MNVRQLVQLLAGYPDDAMVVMSSDGEGNNYSPLADVDEGSYVAESTYSGHLLDEEDLENEDYEQGEYEDVVVLFPTN